MRVSILSAYQSPDNMMKKATQWTFLVVAGFFLYYAPIHAQHNLALYNMPGVQQATYVNPSFIPDASLVIGLPVISNINAGFGNNGFTLKDVGASGFDPRGMHLDYETLLPLVKDENVATGELNTQLFAVGFRAKNHYIAFESREHVMGNFYYPKDAIQLGSDLHAGNYAPGQAYYLNGLAYDLTHFRDFSVTYARQFGRASAGVRFRYLIGLENYSTSGPGVVLTAMEEENVFQVDGQLQLWSAGASSLSGDGSYPIWGQGNRGFAFDFGSTYALGEKITASFSVINLGGIDWSAGVRRKMIAKQIEDPLNEIEKTFDGFIKGNPATNLSYNTALPTLIYIGSAYEMNEKSAFNLLLNSRYAQGKHNLAMALSYSQKIGKPIRASLTYSAVRGSLVNLGAGLAIKVGPVQLFGAADNLLTLATPSNLHAAHINVGVNLVFDKKPKTEIPVADALPADTAVIAATRPASPSKPGEADLQPFDTTQPKRNVMQPPAPIETRPQQTFFEATVPSVSVPGKPTPAPAGYAVIQGEVHLEGQPGKVDHFYLDVYKLLPDGGRELLRTGRVYGGDYKLTLDPAYDYEVSIANSESAPMVAKLSKRDLESAGPNTTRDITLRKTSPAGDIGTMDAPAKTKPQASAPEQAKPKPATPKPAAPTTAKPKDPVAQAPAPEQAKPEPVTPPAPPRAEKPSNAPVQYTVIQGEIQLEGQPGKVNHYYFDVYKLLPGGGRELVRTGRMLGGDYKLYLDRAYDHEITLRHSDSGPLVIMVDKEDLESAGANIRKDITLRSLSSSGSTGATFQSTDKMSEKAAPPVEDLMELSIGELQQEEAEAIQRPVPKEEPLNVYSGQQLRNLKLEQDISIYKDMDVNSKVLARLSSGTEIEVLERTTAEWWMVAYRNRIGWMETRELKQD